MQNNLDELQRKLSQLMSLVGSPGSPAIILTAAPGRRSESPPLVQPAQAPSGTLRAELATVEQQLASISALATNEVVDELLTRKASLQLRIAAGERELAALSNEIAQAQQIEHSNLVNAELRGREWERGRNVVLAQIADIDDHLAGRKLIKADPSLRGSDIQDDIRRKRRDLEQLLERVMEENGLTEADISPPPATNTTQIRPDGSGGVAW